MKLKIKECKQWVLFHQYPSSFAHESQPVYMELCIGSGEVSCDWSGNGLGEVPAEVYHGRVLRWDLPKGILGESANTLMKECSVWLQTILNNYAIEWDGNNNVGKGNEKGSDAYDQIHEHINNHHPEQLCAEVWSVEDWLQRSEVEEDYQGGLSSHAIAERWIDIASGENVHLAGDVDQYITNIIDEIDGSD